MAAAPDSKSDKSPEELLCAAAEAGNEDAIAELISSGADPTYLDASGMTPLMHAATGGHAAAARLLLDAGAPWNALSPEGLSAGDLTSDPATYDLLLDHALRSELILGTVARRQAAPADSSDGVPAETYLDSRVSFSEDRVMDAESKAVMMQWERPLMEAHARAVCASGGGKVLNVGFGMGLVDQAIQRYEPEEHTIIEAHPEVYARMLKLGWGEKKNVKILFGRWQNVLLQLGSYDGIFFDTYGEYYKDMREFHEHLPKLLNPGGVYSYFNGLCGDNAFFHVVYCQLVALELGSLGYSTQFIPLPVKDCLKESRVGIRVESVLPATRDVYVTSDQFCTIAVGWCYTFCSGLGQACVLCLWIVVDERRNSHGNYGLLLGYFLSLWRYIWCGRAGDR